MVRCGLPVVNLKQLGHFLNRFVEKMCPSVTDQNLRAAKSRDDVFVQENGGLFGVSRFDCFGFGHLVKYSTAMMMY